MQPEGLRWAIEELAKWAEQAGLQRAVHLWTYLPLRPPGAQPGSATSYAEADDFAFFNEYFRFGSESHPYFDPLKCEFRIQSHPHSNVATARTGTFAASWKAAEWGDKATLTLAPDVASISESRR